MGRTRSFDEDDVVAAAATSFLATGYEGTSVDDLVRATGLHRGSLYGAFGSKRGLFVAALRRLTWPPVGDDADRAAATDLVLVALLELAGRDPEVRALLADLLGPSPDAGALGARLLDRAGLTGDLPVPLPHPTRGGSP